MNFKLLDPLGFIRRVTLLFFSLTHCIPVCIMPQTVPVNGLRICLYAMIVKVFLLLLCFTFHIKLNIPYLAF